MRTRIQPYNLSQHALREFERDDVDVVAHLNVPCDHRVSLKGSSTFRYPENDLGGRGGITE